MYLIQDSKDVLFLMIAFCLLWLTVFIAWFIYYLIMIARQGYKSIKEMRERVNKVDEVIKTIKDKIENSASYLILISEGVKKITELFKEKKNKAKKRKTI